MRRDIEVESKSSFLGVPKDIAYIMRMLIADTPQGRRIARLVYHNTADCLTNPNCEVTPEQKMEILDSQYICALPKIKIDADKHTYITINFNDYVPNETNSFYRDHSIEIRIIVHFDNWNLQNNDLRAYRIAGEIDSMLNGAKMSGIGITNFVSATQDVYDEEYGGLTLNYRVVRGTEDKVAGIRPMI